MNAFVKLMKVWDKYEDEGEGACMGPGHLVE